MPRLNIKKGLGGSAEVLYWSDSHGRATKGQVKEASWGRKAYPLQASDGNIYMVDRNSFVSYLNVQLVAKGEKKLKKSILGMGGSSKAKINEAFHKVFSEDLFRKGKEGKGVEYLKLAAKQGYPPALTALGKGYEEKSPAKALKNYKIAANLGDGEAQYRLSLIYEKEGEVGEAEKWLVSAAGKEVQEAKEKLKELTNGLYEKGVKHQENKEIKEAIECFQSAASKGHPLAQNEMGIAYRDGNGVIRNYSEAIKYFHKAAQNGVAYAQVQMGDHHFRGFSSDGYPAYKYYKLAAEQGDSSGMYGVGRCYEWESGIRQNLYEAKKYYEKAASLGNTYAQERLNLRKFQRI